MKAGIIIYSNDAEAVWNAFRLANFTQAMGDEVSVFLLGKGVESNLLDTDAFKVGEQWQAFLDGGGKIFACGTCLEMRQLAAPEKFTVATLKDLHEIIQSSSKVITF